MQPPKKGSKNQPKQKFTEPCLYDYEGRVYAASDRNKRWFIEYKILQENGKYKRVRDYAINQFETATLRYNFAKKRIQEISQKLNQKEKTATPLPIKIRTASEAIEEILQLKAPTLRKRTIYSYTSVIQDFLVKTNSRTKFVHAIDRDTALAYRDILLLEGKSGKSVNGYCSYLKAIFAAMVERSWIESNPFQGIKKLRELQSGKNQAFTREQINALRPIIDQDKSLYWAVRLMYYCFIRPAEMLNLQVKDIDFNNNTIFIKSGVAKNARGAFVTLPEVFADDLRSHFKGKPANHLILSEDGITHLGRNTLSARHRNILKNLRWNEDGYTFYSWKHTGVVEAYKNGVDIKSIQLQCRHHSLDMTDVYLKSLGLKRNMAIFNKMPLF